MTSLNTFSAGINTSFSSELNSNAQLSIIRRSASSEDTIEYSATAGTGWTDMGYSKTFTPPSGSNNILVGLKAVFDVKISASTPSALYRIKVTNDSNSEIVYATLTTSLNGSSGTNVTSTVGTSSTTYETKTVYCLLNTLSIDASDTDIGSLGSFEATQSGATYTITFQTQRINATGTNTAYLKDITLTMYWTFLQDVVTEGWA